MMPAPTIARSARLFTSELPLVGLRPALARQRMLQVDLAVPRVGGVGEMLDVLDAVRVEKAHLVLVRCKVQHFQPRPFPFAFKQPDHRSSRRGRSRPAPAPTGACAPARAAAAARPDAPPAALPPRRACPDAAASRATSRYGRAARPPYQRSCKTRTSLLRRIGTHLRRRPYAPPRRLL